MAPIVHRSPAPFILASIPITGSITPSVSGYWIQKYHVAAPISPIVVFAKSEGQVADGLHTRLHRHRLIVSEPVILHSHINQVLLNFRQTLERNPGNGSAGSLCRAMESLFSQRRDHYLSFHSSMFYERACVWRESTHCSSNVDIYFCYLLDAARDL